MTKENLFKKELKELLLKHKVELGVDVVADRDGYVEVDLVFETEETCHNILLTTTNNDTTLLKTESIEYGE